MAQNYESCGTYSVYRYGEWKKRTIYANEGSTYIKLKDVGYVKVYRISDYFTEDAESYKKYISSWLSTYSDYIKDGAAIGCYINEMRFFLHELEKLKEDIE